MGVAGTEVNTADDNDGNWRRYGLRDQKGTEDSQGNLRKVNRESEEVLTASHSLSLRTAGGARITGERQDMTHLVTRKYKAYQWSEEHNVNEHGG